LDHITYARGHAYPNAPVLVSSEGFPLILFSHGWNGFRAQNTYQVEELASHGYIVVAPDHTYGAVATVFPDGSVALNNPLALPTGLGLSDFEFLAAANVLGNQWAEDLSFILDYLQILQPDDDAFFLANKIDFSQVGVMGHSTGGGAAIQFCAQDTRCKAALGMDPYMDPVNLAIQSTGIDRPFLAMFSEGWHQRGHQEFDRFYQNLPTDAYQFAIAGTTHFDFTDLPAFSPLAYRLGLKGPLKGSRVLRIVNDYTLAFFGQYLKGQGSNLMDGSSPNYPELIW
jgi:pimeloyl-ACP methyl ester carboxylesterase